MAELAKFGARIMKEDAVRFAKRNGIQLHIGSSSGGALGTIVLEKPTHAEPPIVGLSLLEGLRTISCPAADSADVCDDLTANEVETVLTVLGPDGLTAIVHAPPDAGPGCEEELPTRSVGQVPRSGASNDRAERSSAVCAVGRAAGSPATISRLSRALRDNGIDINAAVSGGRSVKVVVPANSGRAALRVAHALLIEA